MAAPPPEKAEAIKLRTLVVAAFWTLIVFVGLPVWHYTTSVFRASLPLESMLGATAIPSIPLPIWVLANNHFSCEELDDLIKRTQAAFDQKNSFFRTLNPAVRLVHEVGSSRCGTDIETLAGVDPALTLQLELTRNTYTLQLIPGTDIALAQIPSSLPGSVAQNLADSIYAFFLPEQIAHALLLKAQSVNDKRIDDFLDLQPAATTTDIERQLARAAKPSPVYHLTFSLFTASGAPSSWGVQRALDHHIKPLVTALADTADIRIGTQVQLYSSYAPSIQPVNVGDGFQIRQNDLTAFVNAAEWPLSPSIGFGPTLNFIIYVPHPDQMPLSIEAGETDGWLVPQWGGIFIINPPLIPNPVTSPSSIPVNLAAEDMEPAFETFVSQLLSLLGVLDFEGHHSLPLRLRAHKRFMGLALSARASSSLASLARIAKRLEQIPIPKHVAQLVDNSMANLTAFTAASKDARWTEAVEHAADAYVDSEQAFFDKSMVGQVYFPDEHKVAVYLPLLGPVGVPLVVALIKEIKRFLAV
ncbi:hypothetical protein DV736_g3676, partial [Chaetothyriales sp. CBS 134916]